MRAGSFLFPYVDDVFPIEIGIVQPAVDPPGPHAAGAQPEPGHQQRRLLGDVPAPQIQDRAGEFSFHPRIEILQRGDGPRDDLIEGLR